MQVVVSCYKLRCVKGVKPCGTINSLPKNLKKKMLVKVWDPKTLSGAPHANMGIN